MSEQPLPDAGAGYALGHSAAETRRLVLQHQVYGALTRQFLVGAGVTAGMKVLDLGSGAGDVALLAADLVGPQGRVVGIDANGEILETARARADASGWTTVSFRCADLQSGDPGGLAAEADYDAVVGRWILMYAPEPAELLRRTRTWLRPGGLIAFQESDLRNVPRPYPAAPLHEQVMRWTAPPPGVPGPELEMGPKLYGAFLRAGLPAPQLRLDAPIGGGPNWPGYACLAETVRSLLPYIERAGVATAEQVDVDTLEERLRAELVGRNGVQILPAVIGAWTRV